MPRFKQAEMKCRKTRRQVLSSNSSIYPDVEKGKIDTLTFVGFYSRWHNYKRII